MNLAGALAAEGRWREAVEVYIEILTITQDPVARLMAYANLTGAYIQLGNERKDPEQAWEMYRQAGVVMRAGVSEFPGNPYLEVYLAALMNIAGQPEKAMEIAERELEKDHPDELRGEFMYSEAVALAMEHQCVESNRQRIAAVFLNPALEDQPVPRCAN